MIQNNNNYNEVKKKKFQENTANTKVPTIVNSS